MDRLIKLFATWTLILLVGICLLEEVLSNCDALNFCNGHGKCNIYDRCVCYEGWGATTDISLYKSLDCSTRTCPAGPAWAAVATRESAHILAECSNQGTCNRNTGECVCNPLFTGSACQRTICPNDCSGHGRCKSMRLLSRTGDADFVSRNTSAYLYGTKTGNVSIWDADVIYGCECDSSWVAGIRKNQIQQTEWFGPDCSMRHCPSNDNPFTDENELDCFGKSLGDAAIKGEDGNICHVDCANLGICDYSTGECHCFPGQFGPDCTFNVNANVSFSIAPDWHAPS